MNKTDLLAELANNTYVMIKPSPIEGIGVFALREIPKGCREMFSVADKNEDEWIKVPRTDIDLLPAYCKSLVETYCLYDEVHYFVPQDGFKKMDLVNFLNHSDEPNIVSVNEGEFFETLRIISAGEELLVNYGELVEEAEVNSL